MNGQELRLLRMRLQMTQTEAGAWLGVYRSKPNGVSLRTWQDWEWGKSGIPDEVIASAIRVNTWLSDLESEIAQFAQADNAVMPVYAKKEDFALPGREPWQFRPYHAALARAVAEARLRLVEFDPAGYAAWRQDRPDDETQRIVWAMQSA